MKRKKLARKAGTAIMIAALSLSALSVPTAVFAAETGTKAANSADVGTDVTVGTVHSTKTWVDEQGQAWTDVQMSDGSMKAYKVPSAEDRCSLRYYGVDKYKDAKGEGVKIYGYRIIEPNYNQYGFLGWTETQSAVDCGVALESFDKTTNNVVQVVVKDNDPKSPYYNKERVITSDNITDLARKIMTDSKAGKSFADAGQKVELKWSEENNCYMTKDAKPGTYVVLVEKEDKGIIYNPAIISNDYADANVCCSLSNWIPTSTDPADPVHDSPYWNARNFPYEAGVNEDNTQFVDYGSFHPDSVKSLVTGDNRDLSPQEQAEYLKSHTAVVYQKDTQLNGNVFTIDHGHKNSDSLTGHEVTATGQNKGTYEGIVLGDENRVETMALYGTAYAKKSTIQLEKNIVNASVPKTYATDVKKDSSQGYSKYDDVAEGDEITYDIFTAIPYYASNYFKEEDKFLFAVTDTQSKGLAAVKAENIHVYASTSNNMTDAQAIANDLVKGEELSKKNYTVTINENNSFTVEFTKDYCLSNPGAKIVIRYNTTVTKDAVKGLDGNDNSVFLEYTTLPTAPTDNDDEKTPSRGYKYDFAVTYTFSPTAFKLAEDGSISKAENADGIVTTEDQADIASELTVNNPLAGARFMLQRVGSHYAADGSIAKDTDLAPRTDIPEDKVIKLESLKSIDEKNRNDIRTKSGDFYYNGYRTWLLTSDENGVIKFDSELDGIDEGIYTLQEIEAPKDYTINEKIYVIDVNPKFDEAVQQFIGTDVKIAAENLDKDGTITTYDIKGATFVDGTNYEYDEYKKLLSEYTYSESVSTLQDVYTGKIADLANDATAIHNTVISWNEEDTTKKDVSADMIGIINTKLTRLPSTGGVGTILYTVLGFASAIGGIVILDKTLRKKDENAEA